jgi:hypothetical protein
MDLSFDFLIKKEYFTAHGMAVAHNFYGTGKTA